ERQPLAVAYHELGAGAVSRQLACPRHHRLREVDADGPLHAARRPAHRGAGPAAHVQEPVAAGQLERLQRLRLRAGDEPGHGVVLVPARPAIEVRPRAPLDRVRRRHQSRRWSQLKPRIARKIPAAPHTAITASALRWSPMPLPVTIAPDSPSITCLRGRPSAMSLMNAGAEAAS